MACSLRERATLPKLVIKKRLTLMDIQARCGDLEEMWTMVESALTRSEAILLPLASYPGLEAILPLVAKGPHREEKGTAPPIALCSPVLQATWAGHTSIVSYLVKNYSDIVAEEDDVSICYSPLSDCCSPTPWDWKVYPDSHKHRHSPNIASHVAASLGHVKILQEFSSVGACHEWRDDLGRTPLHWAAYFRRGNAVKYLLSLGASANATNTNGVTPLMDCLEGVKCESQIETLTALIENNADIWWIARDGASVLDMLLRLPAEEKYELICNLVQSKTETKKMIESVLIHLIFDDGVNVVAHYFSSDRAQSNDLAAKCSKFCPAAFADCLLCLTFYCKSLDQRRLLWEHAFQVRRENEIVLSDLAPIQVYGNRQEITSWEEGEQILSQAAQTSDPTEILYQSCLMIERAMGRDNPYVIDTLLNASMGFSSEWDDCYTFPEQAFLRGLELLNACLKFMKRPLCITLNNLYHIDEIDCWVENGYSPNLALLFELLLDTLTLVHNASLHFHSLNVQEFYLCLTKMAFSVLCRMAYLYHKNHGTSSEELPSEIEEWGQRLFSMSSIITLYFAIKTDTPQWVKSANEEEVYVSFIMECFRSWAISSGALYALDCEGHRPINKVDFYFPKPLLELLLEHGAHVDAVNSSNLSPQTMLKPGGPLAHLRDFVPPPPSVLPLACLVAHATVDGHIPYQNLDFVPRHLKWFLSIHDCKAPKGLFKHKKFIIKSNSSIILTIFP